MSKKKELVNVPCPGCGKDVEGHKCRYCGATRSVNQVSGNEIWMRNGRLVAAYKDKREAFVTAARQWGIPIEQWPQEFKGD